MRTNFQMEYQNITMIQGNTVAFNIEVYDESGELMNVDSCDFTCRNGEEVIFHKHLGGGISQTDGIITVRIAPEDTKEVDAGQYLYAMQIGVGDDIFTLMSGTLSIETNACD